jgi:hypothetical protein
MCVCEREGSGEAFFILMKNGGWMNGVFFLSLAWGCAKQKQNEQKKLCC